MNIASSAGLNAIPRMAAYAASKWAAVGFSDSVRLELEQAGRDRVRVTTVCPTYINTGMFDGAKGDPVHPDAQTGGGRRRNLGGDARRAALRGHAVDVEAEQGPHRCAAAAVARHLPRRAGVYNSMDEFTGH